jgi:SnoaL-like domain
LRCDLNRHDVEAFVALLSPDVVWEGTPSFRDSETSTRGRAEVRAWIEEVLEVVENLHIAHPPGVILIEQEGEPGSLIEAWSTADEALVID